MRILWYSLGGWFLPSAKEIEVVELSLDASGYELANLVSNNFAYFFEPTPYPHINGYNPIEMATRLKAHGGTAPRRVVAFVSHPSPVPFEAQCAFASQVGHILGVAPEVHIVAVPDRSSSNGSAKKGHAPGGRAVEVDPGPKVDWQRALDVAVGGNDAGARVPDQARLLVESYVYPQRGGPRLNPTQRRLLYAASAGEISVVAEEIAAALNVQLVTAQRAIRGIAQLLGEESGGRRSPELVGRLVVQYRWFLHYNGG